MSYVNLNNPANFQLQEFEQLGFRYIVSGRPTIGGETYRTIFVLTDAVVTATCPNGDSLSSETLVAGTVIHGFFEDVSVASGSLLAYKAGPITAQEIFDAYKAYVYAQGGIVEGESCAVADIAALLEDKLYSAASLVLIPSGYKVSHLYAERPLDSNGDFTFTRASTATRVGPDGLIQKAKVNLLLHSNTFSNAAWNKIRSSVTSGQSGYDGSSNAWKLESTDTTDSYVAQGLTQSGVQTFSVYAKSGNVDYIYFRIAGSTSQGSYINLSDGSVSSSFNPSNIIGGTNVTDVGNGWYKISIAVNTTTSDVRFYVSDSGLATSAIGSFIYIQDAQLNYGLVAQEYQETTTTSVVTGITNNMPRLDYSGGASCPSLLLEPQRTNAMANSEYFGGYNIAQMTLEHNYATSPEGIQNATRLIENTASGTAHSLSIATPTTATEYAWSVYAKPNGRDYIYLYVGSGVGQGTIIDIANGVKGDNVGSAPNDTKIEDVGNGWYRCTIFVNGIASSPTPTIGLANSSSSFTYTGDGTSGVLLYGAQLEAGSYATSYIPTYGTSATRTADSCYKTGISSLIGQTEGTIYIEVNTNQHISELSDDTSANRIVFYTDGSDYLRNLIRASASTSSNIQTNTTIQAGDKIALAYANNDAVIYKNGVQIGSDTSVTIPATSKINVGSDYNEILNTTNSVNQVLLFKTRLTNAQLAELTTL